MKIAIIHNLPAGGAKVVLYEWVKRLGKKHRVDEYFLSSAEDKFYDTKEVVSSRYKFNYKKLLRFPPGHKLQYLNFIFQFVDVFLLNTVYRNIAERVNAKSYNVILATHDRFLQSPVCLKWLKKPVVYYIHESQVPYEKKEGIGEHGILNSIFNFLFPKYTEWLDKSNVKQADYILVNSHNTARICEKKYGVKTAVMYSGTDTEQWYPINSSKENFVLSVGALDPVKGHNFVINALSGLNENIRPELKIVYDRGSELYKKELLELADKNKVHISFLPHINRKELNLLYNKAILVACAQLKEPLGLVPLEAMACGTPVVAVNEGGFRETIINNKTGVLVDRDIKKFTKAIEYLLTNGEIRAQYSKNACEHVRKNWSWEKAILKLESKLEEIVNNSYKKTK